MLKSVAQVLTSEGLVKPDETVVVGVSGGVDSMALLHTLHGLPPQEGWRLRLHIVHLDHQLRGADSQADAAFVQAAADDLGLPCTIERRDVAALAAARGRSVEEAGRTERYLLFERVCLQAGARVVALGHHADDNAETILHRILRGTGFHGLTGIPRRRALSPGSDIQLIRPLLHLTRDDLERFLAERGVAYREDTSNSSPEPTRNRIRNMLLPLLASEFNPQVREALRRLGEQAQWMEDFLRETVLRTFDTVVISRTDQTLTLNADVIARKSRLLQAELVRVAYRLFGLGEQQLAFPHFVAVLELTASPVSGRQVQLPGGLLAEKRYHQLIYTLPTDEPRESLSPDITVNVPGRAVLPVRGLEIECVVRELAAGEVGALRRAARSGEEYVDFDAVHLPLVLRSRRAGDRFVPLGAPGSKKVSDFLADARVEPGERARVPLLCDQLGPIWVVGHRIDDRVKLTELSRRVLELRARALERPMP